MKLGDNEWVHSLYPEATACHVRGVEKAGGTFENEWRCCCAEGFVGADADPIAAARPLPGAAPTGYASDGCVPAGPAAQCRDALAAAVLQLNAGISCCTSATNIHTACDLLPSGAGKEWRASQSPEGVQCTAVMRGTGQTIPGGWSCAAGPPVGANPRVAGALVVDGLMFTEANVTVFTVTGSSKTTVAGTKKTKYNTVNSQADEGGGSSGVVGGVLGGVLLLIVIGAFSHRKTMAKTKARRSLDPICVSLEDAIRIGFTRTPAGVEASVACDRSVVPLGQSHSFLRVPLC